jgi:hypothetical protein
MWMFSWCAADIIPEQQVFIYAAKLGVEPDMDTLSYDTDKNRTYFAGRVVEPCRAEDVGFVDVERGESLEVTSLENGRWRAKRVSSGEFKEFHLSIEWAKDD